MSPVHIHHFWSLGAQHLRRCSRLSSLDLEEMAAEAQPPGPPVISIFLGGSKETIPQMGGLLLVCPHSLMLIIMDIDIMVKYG